MCDFIRQLGQYKNIFVLTGAGISLPSGIPTYRDKKGAWTASQPIQHSDFITSAAARQRYWARSIVGWRSFGRAQPNAAHRALVSVEQAGLISLLVTQNVDRLHQRAGSRRVIDLHGRLDIVVCLHCGLRCPRSEIQVSLEAQNPHVQLQAETLRPDGDADVPDHLIAQICVPSCRACDGVLKPDVVFFGDNVPRQRVQQSQRSLAQADALLVIGSSLQVYSGFRFCRQAAEQGTPIFCINPGETRAEHLVDHKSEEAAEHLLLRWVQQL